MIDGLLQERRRADPTRPAIARSAARQWQSTSAPVSHSSSFIPSCASVTPQKLNPARPDVPWLWPESSAPRRCGRPHLILFPVQWQHEQEHTDVSTSLFPGECQCSASHAAQELGAKYELLLV